MDYLINYQHILRPTLFIALFALFAYAEIRYPLSRRKTSRPLQWSTNLALAVINSVFTKMLIPLLPVGVALYASEHQIGLFHYFNANYVQIPYVLVFILSLLLLDLIIYCQHVLFHNVPLLWRLHRMHHTEVGLDVSSAVRFHPIEILLSMLIKMSFVLILGVPVAAVIVFEMLLNALALFNHSNIKLPAKIDTQLRKVIVTPEVHWIHHSPIVKETNSNYGFNLVIWDKLFNTYTHEPKTPYQYMSQGLYQYGLQKSLSLKELLFIPFTKR